MKRKRICFLAFSAVVLFCNAVYFPAEKAVVAKAEIPSSQTKTCYVALTFDDGPKADTTPQLLDGLQQRGVHATFFLIGSQIASNAAVVRRMKAEGHQIGNHTWSHKKLQGASDAVVQEEIGKTDRELRELLGDGEYWVRPPYGMLSERQQQLFSVPLVRWSVDPKDWKRLNADGDVAAVLRNVQPGDIILMHDCFQPSVTAALRIVDSLQKRGYRFVTVSQLLTVQGTTPRPGTVYCSAAAQ